MNIFKISLKSLVALRDIVQEEPAEYALRILTGHY